MPNETPREVERMVAAREHMCQPPMQARAELHHALAPIADATAIASSTRPFDGYEGEGLTFSSSPSQ